MAPSRMFVLQEQELLQIWGKSARMHTVRLMNSRLEGPKRMVTRVHLPCWKSMICMIERGNPLWTVTKVKTDRRNPLKSVTPVMSWNTDLLDVDHRTHDNWVASFRTWSRRSLFSGRGSDMQKPIQCVKFTKGIARHIKIRPSLGHFCPGEPHQRGPNAPKFEDRSQEERVARAMGREAAWKLAKSVLKLKEHQRAAFFSPSENRCLPASTLKPEERELLSTPERRCTWSAKTTWMMLKWILWRNRAVLRLSSANWEVQTHEEGTVYVKELDIFLTMKVLENTPAVSSLGKLCDENGYSYEWINGQKPHLRKDGIRIICSTENFVPFVVPGLSSLSSGFSSTLRTPIKQESHSFFIFFILTFFSYSRWNVGSRKGRCTW